MHTPKLVYPLAVLLLSLACALPGGLALPTAEPTIPPSGTVLLQDDFSNPLSGWDRGSKPEGMMDYDGGVFRILVNTPEFMFWSAPGRHFTDVRIEVDTAKLNGADENRAGIICRWDGKQFYFFLISSDGYFAVGRSVVQKDDTVQATLLGQNQMAFSSNIRTGMAVNHLRADCVGNTLTFFINGFPVAQVNDPVLTSGDVGLIAGAFKQGGVDIIFDQFMVLQP